MFTEQINQAMPSFARPMTSDSVSNVQAGVNTLNPASHRQDYNEGIFQCRLEAGAEVVIPMHNLLMSSINDNGVNTIQVTGAVAGVKATTEPTHIVDQERKRIEAGTPGAPTSATWVDQTVVAGAINPLPDNINGLYVKAGAGGIQVTVRRS